MADIAGGLCTEDATASGKTDKRALGAIETYDEPSSGETDKRATGTTCTLGNSGGVTITTYYSLRARDSGLGPPAVYTYWTSTNPASTPTPTPVGSWVDQIILNSWSV